jgi:hypothetical protein
MKTFCLTTMIAVFLLLCTNGLQAQTTKTNLNQIELMKQFIGTWKGEMGNNATFVMEGKHYCNGLEFYWKIEAIGKILSEGKSLFGYDKVNERILDFQIISNSPDIILWAGLFTSLIRNFADYLYSDTKKE